MAETQIKANKKFVIIPIIGVSILTLTLLVLFALQLSNASALSIPMQEMPKYNWVVDEDLGVGEVPGTNPAQRFVVIHPQGWEVLAYCLEPGEDAPPVGTTCELIDENTFWCGDPYQNIRPYQVLQAPQPTNTATSTNTNTPTSTSTATSTPPTNVPTKKPSVTPTPRPNMGGSDLSEGSGLKLSLGFGLFTFAAFFFLLNWRNIFRRN